MPLYDFRCTACNHEFEDNIPSSTEPPACPECKAATEKVPRVPMYAKGKPASPRLEKTRWDYKNASKEDKKKLRGGLD